LFPNPTSGNITFSNIKDLEKVQIINYVGDIIKTIDVNASFNDLQMELKLPAGIYIVQLKRKHDVQSKKLIITN